MLLIAGVLSVVQGSSGENLFSGCLSLGKWWDNSNFCATFKGEDCFSLSFGFQESTSLRLGWSLSSLLYLSMLCRTALSLLKCRGSTLASISRAAVGVLLMPPHTSRSDWFCTLSRLSVVDLLAAVWIGWVTLGLIWCILDRFDEVSIYLLPMMLWRGAWLVLAFCLLCP